MASDTNHVVLIGRLTRDAEERTTASGTTIRSLRLAVNTRRKVGDSWEDAPGYFDVTVFGNDGIAPYLVRGKQLAVSGRLSWREWESKDGSKRQAVEVVANDVQLLGGKDGGSAPADDLAPLKAAFPGAREVPNDDDSIPF